MRPLPRPIAPASRKCGGRAPHDGLDIAFIKAKPVSYETANETFRKACDKAKIAEATIHDPRAKSLTDSDNQGNNAQLLGGHSDARVTARYLRLRGSKVAVSLDPLKPKLNLCAKTHHFCNHLQTSRSNCGVRQLRTSKIVSCSKGVLRSESRILANFFYLGKKLLRLKLRHL